MNETANLSLIDSGNFWFPKATSTYAHHVDGLFSFIVWGSTITFIGIILVTAYFLYKYRHTESNKVASKQVTHNNTLEIGWTIIPTLIFLFIFYWGYKGFIDMSIPPENAIEIHVTGQKWSWTFSYPKSGKKTLSEFVVPVNQPVKLIMSSQDVIHSFFIPNFRMKRDVIPNRYTRVWFEANEEGSYQVFCTEYCGDAHSEMLATLKVVSREEYDEWLKAGAVDKSIPMDQLGAKIYTKSGCNACHSLDGSAKIGPTWLGLYDATRNFEDGTSAPADENYLRESIVEPQNKIVKGYAPVMNTYAGLLSDYEISALIEYIKTLK